MSLDGATGRWFAAAAMALTTLVAGCWGGRDGLFGGSQGGEGGNGGNGANGGGTPATCGDGTCNATENPGNCPADCP